MPARRWTALVLVVALCCLTWWPAVARDVTPAADPNAPIGSRDRPVREDAPRLDLAAMALAGDDLPAEFVLTFEGYLDGEQVASQLLGGVVPADELAATGLRWYYESQYQSPDGQSRIRSYIQEYASSRGARRGFEILENEENFAGPGVSHVDRPGIGVGDEPSELTVSTVQASEGRPSGASLDLTFRVGRLLAGVAIDTVSTTPPDEELLGELAARLDERIRAVLEGDALPGIDPVLATRSLGFHGALAIQEGYLSLVDAYGDAAPPVAIDSFVSGYVRSVALGHEADPNLPVPLVSIAVAGFTSEAGPLALLSDAGEVTPPFAGRQREAPARIPGATASVGFSFVSPITGAGADSFRVMAVVGERLLTVDVQGAESVDEARSVALSLAEQQIACIADEAACGEAELPDGFVPVPAS